MKSNVLSLIILTLLAVKSGRAQIQVINEVDKTGSAAVDTKSPLSGTAVTSVSSASMGALGSRMGRRMDTDFGRHPFMANQRFGGPRRPMPWGQNNMAMPPYFYRPGFNPYMAMRNRRMMPPQYPPMGRRHHNHNFMSGMSPPMFGAMPRMMNQYPYGPTYIPQQFAFRNAQMNMPRGFGMNRMQHSMGGMHGMMRRFRPRESVMYVVEDENSSLGSNPTVNPTPGPTEKSVS